MNNFMEIIEEIDGFDIESQAVLVDLINKRFNEHNREVFINETVKSIEEINSGDFQSGTSDDLFNELGI